MSTFGYEVFRVIEQNDLFLAITYIAGTLGLSFLQFSLEE